MPKTLSTDIKDLTFCADYFPAQGAARALLFCLPGGGASKGYYDLSESNSFARNMSACGYNVLTMDHPGTGSNPLPADHPFLSPRDAADYLAKALESFRQDLNANIPTIGIGHSMGGMAITLIQGQHKPFDALGLFGSSPGGLDWGLDDHEKAFIGDETRIAAELEALTLRKFGANFLPHPGGGPSGKSITFGGEKPELVEALRQNLCELYGSGGMMSMLRGSFTTEVSAIDVPVFFAFGDHDIGIPPEDVPAMYPNLPSHELLILENTGHNSFAFSSLTALCARLDGWVQKTVA